MVSGDEPAKYFYMNIVFLLICAAIIIPLALWSERNIRNKPDPQPENTNDDDDFEFPTFI